MKYFISALLCLLLLPMIGKAQDEVYPVGKLLQDNEEIVMAFITKNRKIVTINADKNQEYIVFRYGDKDSIKFQYPKELNESSWNQFTYYSFVKNDNSYDAAEKYKLSFFYNGIRYTISQFKHIPTEDEELELLITGIVDGCQLSAKPHTRMGTLAKLQNTGVMKD